MALAFFAAISSSAVRALFSDVKVASTRSRWNNRLRVAPILAAAPRMHTRHIGPAGGNQQLLDFEIIARPFRLASLLIGNHFRNRVGDGLAELLWGDLLVSPPSPPRPC